MCESQSQISDPSRNGSRNQSAICDCSLHVRRNQPQNCDSIISPARRRRNQSQKRLQRHGGGAISRKKLPAPGAINFAPPFFQAQSILLAPEAQFCASGLPVAKVEAQSGAILRLCPRVRGAIRRKNGGAKLIATRKPPLKKTGPQKGIKRAG